MAEIRLLLVDDHEVVRTGLRMLLESQSNINIVAEAKNGEEAIAFYERERPDLVTLDIIMPKMDGVAALKGVRAADPEAQVIMISAVDQREKLAECIASGALDFIVKPFDADRLRKIFGKYL